MDPFTLALATFGVQKLRGKSTKRALRDAAIIGGASYGLGKFGNVGAFQGPGGSMSPFSSMGFGQGKSAADKNILEKIIGEKRLTAKEAELANLTGAEAKAAMKGSGILGLSPGQQIFLGGSALGLMDSGEEPVKPPFTEEDYKKEYEKQTAKLKSGFEPVTSQVSLDEVVGDETLYAAQGGLAEIKKFNEGGINYLPSKTDHNEKDYNNYVRAKGYVEDGSGNGDKDEDTMLAQLADGEFVSRADAVLGAGIIAGASPGSEKSMRSKGAEFFYDQQKRFKRVYDLLNGSKTN